jgi:hypothetical protein
MEQYQSTASRSEPYPDLTNRIDAIEKEIRNGSPGIMSSQFLPALGAIFRSQTRSLAHHRAAAALVATTKQRLETNEVPETFEELAAKLVPPASRDPFTADQPLLMKRTDDAMLIYSIGPDGENDGGPPTPGGDKVEGNDDVGLRMAL